MFRRECTRQELAETLRELDAWLAPLDAPRRYRVRLLVEELLVNLFGHADFGEEEAKVRLRVERRRDGLSIRLEDRALPFDPRDDAPAPNLQPTLADRPPGGLGLHLLRTYARSIDYRREGRWNVLELIL
jgi:anti-sigma regulatory factor (Ser/Thr protein kinase)